MQENCEGGETTARKVRENCKKGARKLQEKCERSARKLQEKCIKSARKVQENCKTSASGSARTLRADCVLAARGSRGHRCGCEPVSGLCGCVCERGHERACGCELAAIWIARELLRNCASAFWSRRKFKLGCGNCAAMTIHFTYLQAIGNLKGCSW